MKLKLMKILLCLFVLFLTIVNANPNANDNTDVNPKLEKENLNKKIKNGLSFLGLKSQYGLKNINDEEFISELGVSNGNENEENEENENEENGEEPDLFGSNKNKDEDNKGNLNENATSI